MRAIIIGLAGLLEALAEFVVFVGVACAIAAAIVAGMSRNKNRKGGSLRGAVGNALQELNAIMRPSVQHQIKAKLERKKEEDGEGGSEDPTAYYERLRKDIDDKTGEQSD
jgi:D-aminopeptidase